MRDTASKTPLSPEPDWLERLRERQPMRVIIGETGDFEVPESLWPLLCDVVERADRHAGDDPELDRVIAALRAEVERDV